MSVQGGQHKSVVVTVKRMHVIAIELSLWILHGPSFPINCLGEDKRNELHSQEEERRAEESAAIWVLHRTIVAALRRPTPTTRMLADARVIGRARMKIIKHIGVPSIHGHIHEPRSPLSHTKLFVIRGVSAGDLN